MGRKPVWPPTIHRHKSGRAYIRHKGREYYLGRHGSDEARAEYLRVVGELEAGRDPARLSHGGTTPGLTVRQAVDEWWARESPRFSERGRERDKFRLSLEPLLALFGPTPAADLDADRLEQVQLAMASASWMTPEVRARREKVTNRGPLEWSRRIVNQRIGRIKAVWRWLERKKLVPAGAWAALCALPGLKEGDPRVRDTPRVRAATPGDLAAVLSELPVRGPIRAMLRLMFWSGMRPAEVRIMRAGDVDRSADVWVYRPAYHKTDRLGDDRLVVLGPRCRAVLRPWLEGRGAADYLFRTRPGSNKPYPEDSFCQAVRRAAQRAGVPGFHPYRLRHACKDRLTNAHDLDTARAQLGQRSLTTTNGYGQQLDLEKAKGAMRESG